MDRHEVEVHKLAKKRTRPICSHLEQTNLVNEGFIIWLLGNFSSGTQQVVQSGQHCFIMPTRVANQSAGFDSSCPFTELAIQQASQRKASGLFAKIQDSTIIWHRTTKVFRNLRIILGDSGSGENSTSKSDANKTNNCWHCCCLFDFLLNCQSTLGYRWCFRMSFSQ